jgi:hypothetical protein
MNEERSMSGYAGAIGLTADLEMALRLLRGVVGVSSTEPGRSNDLSVLVTAIDEQITASVEELVGQQAPGSSVTLVELSTIDGLSASHPRSSESERVVLSRVSFSKQHGVADVVLSIGNMQAKGMATGTPLISGVLATLDALASLGLPAPFALSAVDHLGLAMDAPVVVSLRPDDGGSERIGVARARDDCEAASRATLSALNRHLSQGRSEVTSGPTTLR